MFWQERAEHERHTLFDLLAAQVRHVSEGGVAEDVAAVLNGPVLLAPVLDVFLAYLASLLVALTLAHSHRL